jgi:hypothetical protein
LWPTSGSCERQLAELGSRQEAVASRRREIRDRHVRQHARGAVTAEDWLG